MKDEQKIGTASVAGEFQTSVVITPPVNEPEEEQNKSAVTVMRSMGESLVMDIENEEEEFSPAKILLTQIAKGDTDESDLITFVNATFELIEMNHIAQKVAYVEKTESLLLLESLGATLTKDNKFKQAVDKRIVELRDTKK